MADELNDFVGAIAQDDILPREAKFFRDRAAQGPGTAVGIKVGAIQCIAHGGQRLGRGAERIFVRGQFNDVRRLQAHFAGQFLDRFAGFVGDQLEDMLVRGFPHRFTNRSL